LMWRHQIRRNFGAAILCFFATSPALPRSNPSSSSLPSQQVGSVGQPSWMGKK
jgi:hypothetical protein